MKIFRHFILVLGLVIPVSLCLVLSVHAASPLNSSTRVDLSASVSGLSGSHSFYYYSNSYNYSVPFMMSGSIVQTLIEDRTISGELETDYNVRFQFPESMLGMRITGTWHIPLQYNVSEKYWWYDTSSDDTYYVNAEQFQTLATDLTWRSQFSVKDQSFPDGLSVSLADRTASGSNWYDLTLVFDDFLIPSNFYSNYFSIDLTYYYNFQAYVNSIDNQSPIVEFLSAVTQDVSLSVRTNAYSSSSIVLSVPQLGNATNSQLYYDVLAAINNANISYDITVDGTDVTVDIDTSSLAQQTTVANILTVLNNLKSDTASIPTLSSNFSSFATAALTYLGNISADSDVINSVLTEIISIYDRLGILSSQLSSIYDLLNSNFSDYLNSFYVTPYTSSYSFNDSLPASFSSLVAYHYRMNRSPSVSTPATFNNIQSYGISGVFSDYTLDRVISVDYLTGTVKSYSYVEFDHCTVRSENGIYYWDFSVPDYNYLPRDIYFVSNIATYGTGSVNNLWVRGSVFRYYPSDQTYNTSALANAYLSSTPLRIYFFDDSFVSSTTHITIDSFAPRSSLSCTNGVLAEVSYVRSTLYPFNNLSSLIATYVVGFTGLTSNSVTDLQSISQASFNRWVSIIQQAISSQLSVTQTAVYPTYVAEAGSWESTVHSYEVSLWSEVNQRLSSILGSAAPPAALLSAATWYTDAIESIWASLGVFGFVLSVSLIGGLIVVVLGKINQFPKGK